MKLLSLASCISTKKICSPIVAANCFSQSAFYSYTSKEAPKPQLFDFRKSEPKAAPAAKPFTTVNSAVPKKKAAPEKPGAPTTTASPKAPSESIANIEQVESLAPRSNLEEIQTFLNTNDFASSGDEWSRSFFGVGSQAFSKEITDILLAPINIPDIEIKTEGLIYLPEIKYRRILNKAFGPGAWGLVPRGPTSVTTKNLSREYALICQGRFVSQARGEQDYFDKEDISVAAEGAKSNALTRCCKDLGIASELWDPCFIRKFKEERCEQSFAQHTTTGRKRVIWRIKGNPLEGPYKL